MKKPLYVRTRLGELLLAGYIDGKTFYRQVGPDIKGYAMPGVILDDLVDRGIETIVLQEPHRRLVSSIEDWQDYGLMKKDSTVLSVVYMDVN